MKSLRGGLGIADLDEILVTVGETWKELLNSRIIVFGGTGFVGTWLVSTLLHANEALNLGLELVVPTRNVTAAKHKLRVKSHDPITLLEEDIRSANPFTFGSADFYVHAATPSVLTTGSADSALVEDATVGGTRKILSHIAKYPTNPTFLHTSSGAVYGPQPLDLENREEVEAPLVIAGASAYSKAKADAEMLISKASLEGLIRGTNPRLFAFLGPHISLDQHFAIGNFVKDGMEGKRIQMTGNPNTVRSYLYPTDLTTWLLKCLANPSLRPMNIGGEIGVTMLELAIQVSELTSNLGVDILNPSAVPSRYVPSTQNAQQILGVSQKVSLVDGLERWIRWIENPRK
jgi:nucleoside-diphosphate-sugar epimerase